MTPPAEILTRLAAGETSLELSAAICVATQYVPGVPEAKNVRLFQSLAGPRLDYDIPHPEHELYSVDAPIPATRSQGRVMMNLKPCPFCGSRPGVEYSSGGVVKVYCPRFDCQAKLSAHSEAHAEKLWNRRPCADKARIEGEAHLLELITELQSALASANAENERLREALEPFAKAADSATMRSYGELAMLSWTVAVEHCGDFTTSDFFRARAALEAGKRTENEKLSPNAEPAP